MSRRTNGIKQFYNEDLVLKVSDSFDRRNWDEDKYEQFIDELCGERDYQKEAIYTALRYLLGGEYENLLDLAKENFKHNEVLRERYSSIGNIEKHLQLPNKLAASLDLATGTGKSYVMYGIAAIMLAEGEVDRVLVLCPSITIESGLLEKFKLLARDTDLRDLLPANAVVNSPSIINASESIVSGSICIENYHAILKHVRSSIHDSLQGKGKRTLILNDEAHHVANEVGNNAKKWKEFLTDSRFGFHYIIGVSGTCYIGNDYFSDVIYRYSLRKAIEENFVKKVHYVAEMPKTKQTDNEKWQLVRNRHEKIRAELKKHKLRPLTIVVTKNIRLCEEIAEKFKAFLKEETGKSQGQIDELVLVIHSKASGLPRLASVNDASSKIEWIFSVSMLNEGWDVKRVFQIVPHEKRAFESKLLIAQVLGRGLRVPDGWKGEQPKVTVFNHDKWANDIRHLVNEVLELEKRIPTFPIPSSEFNFELLNVKYDPKPDIKTYEKEKPYKLFEKGYVDLSTEQAEEEIKMEFEEVGTGMREQWKTKIKHKTYTPREIAEVMFQRFEDLADEGDRSYYTKEFPIEELEEVVRESLKRINTKDITENMRQKFLQSLGTLQRKDSQVVRYNFKPRDYPLVSTTERPQESVSASDLKNGKSIFYTDKTKEIMPDEYEEFYKEAVKEESGYKCEKVKNSYDFRTPLNAVIADSNNEYRFVKGLVDPDNTKFIDKWIKSTPRGFYGIDYSWKKGTHSKRGKFNPDFFIKIGKLIWVIEIKDDSEIREPSVENKKKNEFALAHFKRINAYLRKNKIDETYQFNFLTPENFTHFFQSIRNGEIESFRSDLDVALVEKK